MSNTRSTNRCPISTARLASSSPEVSLSKLRVSLTVSTAIFSGTKAASSLILMQSPLAAVRKLRATLELNTGSVQSIDPTGLSSGSIVY
ncbi:hypothetical protein D3C80_2037210 [compost metagenome]